MSGFTLRDRIRNEHICEKVGVAPVEDKIRESRLRWFSHIKRKPSDDPVAERSLFLWNNDHLRNLTTQNRKVILPLIFPALENNMRGHWNQAVQGLTLNVRKLFFDADQELLDNCSLKFHENEAKERELQAKRELIWKQLENIAASKAISNEAVLVSRKVSSLTMTTLSPRTTVGS
ncbi:hypothetical protein KFK09_017604 [Dendrobium nobile]|uniref:Uncharacterized protein n=1 Tax=Dendrobium nobile TaxID=94219 RepID=A0A8T3B3I4_DENNO|nr:hypothetical protein KFK09_017604 [Dendrobium nobile]